MKEIGTLPWKKGEGWSKDELVWTDEDTAFVMATVNKNNKPIKRSFESLTSHHESLSY